MRRRAPADVAAGGVRAALIAHYSAHIAKRPWAVRIYGGQLETLRAGEPLVLPGWALTRHVPPGVLRGGANAYFRVERDGGVVEIDCPRDPNDETRLGEVS